MIFTLHDGFGDLTPQDWVAYSDAINNLLMAHRNGWHIFAPDRRVLNNLLACDFLGSACLTALSGIRNKYVEISSMKNVVRRMVVIYDRHSQVSHHSEKHWHLDIQTVANNDYLMPFNLVLENVATDGAFWQLIFDAVAHEEVRFWVNPKYHIYNGGGGSLTHAITYLADRRVALYCIMDSDKRSPFAPLGETAFQTVKALIDGGLAGDGENGLSKSAFHVGKHVLSVREAENLIPLTTVAEILDEIKSSNFDIVSRVVPTAPNLPDQDVPYWAYYDIKTSQPLPTFFYHIDEVPYFEILEERVGSPMRSIRDNLLNDTISFLSGKNCRQRTERFGKLLLAGPFGEEIRGLFWDVFSLGCTPPSRWS